MKPVSESLARAVICAGIAEFSIVLRRCGDLQIRSGKVVKTVFFDHGRVVFAASNLKKDRLGEALIALGRITDDDFLLLFNAGSEDHTFQLPGKEFGHRWCVEIDTAAEGTVDDVWHDADGKVLMQARSLMLLRRPLDPPTVPAGATSAAALRA